MQGVVVVLVVAALIAGCDGDETSSTSDHSLAATSRAPPAATAAPSTNVSGATTDDSTTTAPSTEVSGATTDGPTATAPSTEVSGATTDGPTATAPSTTMGGEPAMGPVVLRPDGVGGVDLGTPADVAMTELSAVLGRPDRVETIEPVVGDCVEGAGWLDCVYAMRVVDEGRVAVWDAIGLEVALVDTDQDGSPAALQFGDWQATIAPGDTALTTLEGIHTGLTVRLLRQAAPSVEFTYNEGALDSYYAASPDGAGYWGRLDWNPTTTDIDPIDVGAVQTALNQHGADLAVDGVWGPRTEAAWLAFLTGNGIEPVTPQLWLTPEIGAALGLPPDDIVVATIEPRQATDPA